MPDPTAKARRAWRSALGSLQGADYNHADEELLRLLELADSNPVIRQVVHGLRRVSAYQDFDAEDWIENRGRAGVLGAGRTALGLSLRQREMAAECLAISEATARIYQESDRASGLGAVGTTTYGGSSNKFVDHIRSAIENVVNPFWRYVDEELQDRLAQGNGILEETISKVSGLRKTIESLLEGRGQYFDPATTKEYFERTVSLEDDLRELALIYRDLPSTEIPKVSDTSDFEGRGYFTRAALETLLRDLDYILELRPTQGDETTEVLDVMSAIQIFISHSSHDAELAGSLANLFRTSLNLSATEIRCTSVAGYRLPVGADTEKQLRQEVYGARVLVGVVSESSLKSAYFMFEMGARWGAKRFLAPVLAPGFDASSLPKPLDSLNALRTDDRGQLLQLVADLADELNTEAERAESYEQNIQGILSQSAAQESS